MKIGQRIYTSYGYLTVIRKEYSAVSNSVVWYGMDQIGNEYPITKDIIETEPVKAIEKEEDDMGIKLIARAVKLKRGLKGEKGDRGPMGFRGPKGDKGDKGEKGDAGKDGRDGIDGKDGKDGKRGEKGLNGKDGKDGKDGHDGKDGKPGKDGLNGLNGTSGGGIKRIYDASDVKVTNPTDGQALTYQAATKKWINGTVAGTSHDAVTLAGEDFLSLSGQEITANPIDLDNLSATGTPSAATFLRGDNTWATPSSSGGIVRTITTSSGAFTAGSSAGTDYVYFIAGAHAVALPTAVSNTNRYTFKNIHSANITITPDGAETIEGGATLSLAPSASIDIVSNNSVWFVI